MARPGQQIWASWWENRSKKLDWKILALSLLAACGLWFMGHLARASEFTLTYNLIPESSANCDYVGEKTIPIKVIVKAKGFDLGDRWFQKDHTSIPLSIKSFNCIGDTQLIDSKRLFSLVIPTLNEGLQLSRIIPKTIPILLSKQVQKKLPVQVNGIAKTKTGFEFSGKFEIEPKEVPVEGDEALVESITALHTQAVEHTDKPQIVSLIIPEGLEVGQETVRISAIMDTLVSKTFDIKPEWIDEVKSKKLYMSDDMIQVTIVAKANELRDFQKNQIKVIAIPKNTGEAILNAEIKGLEPKEVIMEKATITFVAI